MFDIWHSARRHVESGALKLIASASPERLPGAPEVPAIAETYPGVEVIAFNAIVAPGATPAPIVERLSADIRAIVESGAFKEKTKDLGINSYGNAPGELKVWMLREIERWKDVAKAANIKAE
jgi:tripartite-type tricarboxylate transporter receptor subunit TctC